jgi:hypothetical protein
MVEEEGGKGMKFYENLRKGGNAYGDKKRISHLPQSEVKNKGGFFRREV